MPKYAIRIGTEIGIRPEMEYLLTSTCGNANYGSRNLPDWENVPPTKYQDGPIRSEYYQRPLNYGIDTNYPYAKDTSGGLDVFGLNVEYPTFTIAGFFYRPQAASGQPSGLMWSTGTGPPVYLWGQNIIKTYIWAGEGTGNRIYFGYATPLDINQDTFIQYPNPAIDTWTHYTISHDGTKLKQYINGVLHAETQWPAGVPITSDKTV